MPKPQNLLQCFSRFISLTLPEEQNTSLCFVMCSSYTLVYLYELCIVYIVRPPWPRLPLDATTNALPRRTSLMNLSVSSCSIADKMQVAFVFMSWIKRLLWSCTTGSWSYPLYIVPSSPCLSVINLSWSSLLKLNRSMSYNFLFENMMYIVFFSFSYWLPTGFIFACTKK